MRLTYLLLLLAIAGPSRGQQPVQQQLAAYMQAHHAVNRFAGVVLVTRHDSVLDSKFALASITKHLTAIAVLQLAERGHLRLTDNLARFFPAFPNGRAITLHHLLTHTAGLAVDFEPLYLDHTNVSRDSALAHIQRLPVRFAPGTQIGYSNVGYYLLGRIVEQAAGVPYGEYLAHAGLNSNTAPVPRLARLYYRDGADYAKNPYINWDLNVGHDGLYATAGDLANLDRAMRGTALLSEASKALMATPHNARLPGTGLFNRSGYGVFIDPSYNHGHPMLTHNGMFYGAVTTYDRYPQDQVLVTVLSNNESDAKWIGHGLAGILFGKAVELPYLHRPASPDAAALPAYAGQYGMVRVSYAGGQLHLGDPAAPLVAEAARKFFRQDNPDHTVEFLTTAKGAVYALVLTRGGVREMIRRSKAAR
jgi:CubicO group peptidase (beta-lactamase class C family)